MLKFNFAIIGLLHSTVASKLTSPSKSSQVNLSVKFFLPLLAAIVACTPLAIDTYLPAMSIIAEELNTNMSMMQLTISLFLGGYAAGLLIFGALADIFGRRPIVLFGLIGYSVCSLLLAVCDSVWQFLALRLIQAFVGAAATVPISGYVKALYGKNMAKGMSYVSMIMMIAPMVAPTIGVALLALKGWPLIFFVLGSYGLVVLLFAWQHLPKVDRSPMTDTLFNTIFKAYRIVLSEKAARRHILIVIFGTFSFFGYLTGISFVYMDYYGVSESTFGLLFGFHAVVFLISSFINTRLVPRYGSLKILKGAFVVVVISGLSLFTVNYLQMSLQWTVGFLSIFLGSVVVLSSNNDSLILLQFSEQTGTATGVIGVLRFGFGALAGPILALLHDGTSMALCYTVLISVVGISICLMMPNRLKAS